MSLHVQAPDRVSAFELGGFLCRLLCVCRVLYRVLKSALYANRRKPLCVILSRFWCSWGLGHRVLEEVEPAPSFPKDAEGGEGVGFDTPLTLSTGQRPTAKRLVDIPL